MEERRFDVFLSYNSADRPAVERIAQSLRGQRVEPWWDRWALTPGSSWQEEIVEGLQACRACAVIVGPAGLGDWAREELAVAQDLAAKDRTFRIFLVLLPDAPELSDPSLAFLRTRTWVDLRNGAADHDGLQDLVSAITGARRRRDVVRPSVDACPYRGLEAFDEESAEFFFGRENDVALIVEKLKASRFLAVLGSSGSGKSSLLRAGLIPALRRGGLAGSEEWTLRVFTPTARPLTTLAAQMTHLFPETPMQQTLDLLREDERSLDLATSVALAERPPSHRVVLVVDQLEELFTLCGDDDERGSFLANLLYAAAIPGGRIVVVVGMRADFYHRCAPYPGLRVLVADHQLLVGPLDAEGLRQAIEEPARQVGLELEAGLTETITDDVEGRLGILPLLEHVLLEVWQRRRGTMLTLEAYVASGRLEGALAQRANDTYKGLAPVQQDIARRVFLRLIQPGDGAEDTRRRAGMGELVTYPGEEDDVESVVRLLADQRLVTTGLDDASGVPVVDITHETLIRGWPELRMWIDDDRDALRAQRHVTEAATEWDRRGRQTDDTFSGARLAYWKERGLSDLTELERAFLAAGHRRHAAQQRRVRLVRSGVVLGLTVVAIVALWLIKIRIGSDNAYNSAFSQDLAERATAVLQTDPARSLHLAADAYEHDPTPEARRALRQAVSTPGSRVDVLNYHEGFVTSVAFSPDGRRVVSAGHDATVRVWDLVGEGESFALTGHQGPVNSAAFSPDGRRVVSAGNDATVRVWDVVGRGEPAVLRGHQGPITSAAFSPDGRLLVSAGDDATVRVWDLGGGEPAVLRGHQGPVNSAAFSPDGRRVVSAGEDAAVRVWDVAGGGEPAVLRGHQGPVNSAAFSPDGRRVVSAGNDAAVRVWDWAGAGQLAVLAGHRVPVRSSLFSPDGQWVVSAGDDAALRVWDVAGGGEPAVLRGHQGPVTSASFSPDGRLLVSAGEDATVRVWDWVGTGQPTVLKGHDGPVNSAAFSPDGRRVVSAGDDATVRVWDLGGGEPIVLRGHQGPVNSAAFSPDGQRVVSAGDDATVRVWDLGGGEPIVLRGHQGPVNSAAFSPDGQRVVSAGDDATVRVWDLGGGEPIVLRGHQGPVNSAAFSPDGQRVVSAGDDATVRVWDLGGGEPIVLRGHQGPVNSAAFSPDGQRVVSAGDDATVRVWDVAGEGEPIVLWGHRRSVNSAAFHAEGQQIVSAGNDATVRLWDLGGGHGLLLRGSEFTVLRGHQARVSSVAFSPDGQRVVSTGEDASARVWECEGCDALERLVSLARSRVTASRTGRA